jgi:hypothetical protein
MSFLVKTVLALLALVVLGAIFICSGVYDISATSGHTKPLSQVLRRRILPTRCG